MSDLISRQAAIDLLKQMRMDGNMIPWEGKDVFARIRKLPPAQPESEEFEWLIGYGECASAMLKMWMDNVLTDGEYNHIMYKLNKHWERRTDGTKI